MLWLPPPGRGLSLSRGRGFFLSEPLAALRQAMAPAHSGARDRVTPHKPHRERLKRRVQLSRLRTVAPGLLCSPLPLSSLCLPERPPSLGQGRLPPRVSANPSGPLQADRVCELHFSTVHIRLGNSLLKAFWWVDILTTIFPAGCLPFSTIPFMSSVSGTLSPLPTHPLVSLLGSFAFSYCLLCTCAQSQAPVLLLSEQTGTRDQVPTTHRGGCPLRCGL